MTKTEIKSEPRIVGVKFHQEDLDVMEEWAEKHRLPLSWVVRRCVEVGIPIFLANPISGNGDEEEE
jgi:hypothetical protein